ARRILSRERRLVEDFAEDRRKELEQFNVVQGEATFTSDHTLAVNGDEITADRFIVATGSRIVVPPLKGLDDCGYIIPETALARPFSFKSLIVIGAGPVGCEFSQYFARLGVKVTLLQDAPHILRAEDEDVARAVCEGLHEDGIEIVTGTRFRGATQCDGGKRVTVQTNEGERDFEADEILCTVDRRPTFEGLELRRAGVRVNHGIEVDEYLQSSNPRIYAAGDAIGRRMLVHAAVRYGEIAAENALISKSVAADFDMLDAHSIYTDPEVAVVGLSERSARGRGINFRAASYQFADHGRAMTEDALIGFVKILALEDGTIAGITIVGKEASELAHEALTLLYFKANVRDVVRIPHLHPTLAEIITYPAAELCG
ncbi:MAG: NAD(P)/FAD-dependent oxidoreductase, partial [Candidatus Eremiobacteraeota bacterium]|nr:NAD(P)/FAD-dependent oxidoreductase [Candidatus Eremiobacteraeota bacterium]